MLRGNRYPMVKNSPNLVTPVDTQFSKKCSEETGTPWAKIRPIWSPRLTLRFREICKYNACNEMSTKLFKAVGIVLTRAKNSDQESYWSRVARFFLVRYTKTGKMYQINTKCTKWSKNSQMAVKYSQYP
jgi:hypothetical protein